ncbi:DUF106 domain-containing protein [Candidatus Bathyarchaeota archaeon]|nr:DUF106 domain-containing protein [Candidatus Bathyarchaeota archaeon]
MDITITIIIMGIAATITFIATLANRLMINPEQQRAWRKEIMEWNAQLRRAQKKGDKKQIEKLMKKQQYIIQLSSKMTAQSLKVSFLMFIPLLIVWQFLGSTYGAIDFAIFPGIGPRITFPLIGAVAPLYWWYPLCAFFFGRIFSQLFGITGVR